MFPNTSSNERIRVISVRGELTIESAGDLRGVLAIVQVVNDMRGETRVEQTWVDFTFKYDFWFIFDEIEDV